ncbi:hypothetical protein ACTFIR_003853 [Dictyostelium discoideum]
MLLLFEILKLYLLFVKLYKDSDWLREEISMSETGEVLKRNICSQEERENAPHKPSNYQVMLHQVSTIPSLQTVPTTVFRRTRSKLTSRWTSVPLQTSLERIKYSKLL